MPFKIIKIPKKNLYKVINTRSKFIHSKATTKNKAIAQINLLTRFEK
jgi:hypothetical protein